MALVAALIVWSAPPAVGAEATGDALPTASQVELAAGEVSAPQVEAEWPCFRANSNTSTAPTPTTAVGAWWTRKLYTRQDTSDMSGVSDPILVDGKLFVAVKDTLIVVDPSTGETAGEVALAGEIDTTCRMAYADGVIVVPLHAGVLQAVVPDDYATAWVTPEVPDADPATQQSLSTLTTANGYLYAGTANANKTSGYLRCVRLSDGEVIWTHQADGSSSYYWCGAAACAHGLVVAQTSGEVDLMSPAGESGQAQTLATVRLPSTVSSSVVLSSDDAAYVMGYDGTFYKIAVGKESLSIEAQVKLGSYSISTPTVAVGKVYVGGSTSSSMQRGALWVVDAGTLALEQTVSAFDDGGEIQGSVCSSPLVVARDDGTYVYFTANDGVGGVYVYKVGEEEAQHLYVPEYSSDASANQQDYTLSSPIADGTGALYYVNDSGNLFKLGRPAVISQAPDTESSEAGAGANPQSEATVQTPTVEEPMQQPETPDGSEGLSDNDGSALGLLDDTDSDSLAVVDDSLDADTVSGDSVENTPSSAETTKALPLWPLIGMIAGMGALVFAVVWRGGHKSSKSKEG